MAVFCVTDQVRSALEASHGAKLLRVTQQKSSAGAKAYFCVSDYLSDKQEITGEWGGKGAISLGLAGVVDKPHFDQLCDNINPITATQLTGKTREGRRVGYDMTWSVPKSVSLVHALLDDDRVLEAFRASIRDTMGEMESDMQARVRKGGEEYDRDTGNMLWAEFVHLTSRPVNGVPCPQLHSHCFVFNATHDGIEDQWKAGQFGKIKQGAYYWQTVQQTRLVNRLQALGYEIRKTAKDFEIVGVPESAIKKFSLRTQQIEDRAALLGVTRPETKAKLGATTREAKNDAIPYSRLVAVWQERLTAHERNALSDLPKLGMVPPTDNARHAQFAVHHSFERASVIDERRLQTLAMRHGLGEVTPEGVRAEVNRVGLLKRVEHGKTWVTSKQVLAEESRMIAFAAAGKGTCRALSTNDQFGKTRKFESSLSTEQQAVIEHLLTSPDRVMLVRGAAGTGKTTLTKEAVARMGVPVTMLAPTTPAVDVLKSDGFTANTLARFLVDERMQASAQGAVVWLDEAGIVGTKSMASLFEVANRINARVVLMGDKRQLASVERGSPLRVLEDIAKLPVAEVTVIRRQSSGNYRDAVKLLAKGDAGAGFDKLSEMGWVQTLPVWEPYKPVARQYVDALERKETALIICPTHAEGEKVTEAVRDRLKREGTLGDDERTFERLVATHWTEAEREEASREGSEGVAQFHRAVKGFKAGQRVALASGSDLAGCAASFATYRPETIQLAAGDRIRITASGKDRSETHRLNNGALYTVTGFDKHGDLKLENGWRLAKDFGHFTHAYVSTDYGAQGRTVDHVMVVASAQSYPAVNARGFYVDVSRGRKSATVFTDDCADLREAVQRCDARMSATELVQKAKPQLWRRMTESIHRMQMNAVVAAKRAAHNVKEAIKSREGSYELG